MIYLTIFSFPQVADLSGVMLRFAETDLLNDPTETSSYMDHYYSTDATLSSDADSLEQDSTLDGWIWWHFAPGAHQRQNSTESHNFIIAKEFIQEPTPCLRFQPEKPQATQWAPPSYPLPSAKKTNVEDEKFSPTSAIVNGNTRNGEPRKPAPPRPPTPPRAPSPKHQCLQ